MSIAYGWPQAFALAALFLGAAWVMVTFIKSRPPPPSVDDQLPSSPDWSNWRKSDYEDVPYEAFDDDEEPRS